MFARICFALSLLASASALSTSFGPAGTSVGFGGPVSFRFHRLRVESISRKHVKPVGRRDVTLFLWHAHRLLKSLKKPHRSWLYDPHVLSASTQFCDIRVQ